MVSDSYTVQFLLEATRSAPPRVEWRENSSGALATRVDDVELLLEEIQFRAAPRLGLRFRSGNDEYWLYSPQSVGWFERRYASEDDRRLAELMTELFRAATQQCADRMNYELQHPEEVRERIYHRLLFGSR